MRRMHLFLLAAILAFAMSGCKTAQTGSTTDAAAATPGSSADGSPSGKPLATNPASPSSPDPLPEPSASAPGSASDTAEADSEKKLKQTARDIVDMLRERDLDRLAKAVDPEKGLLFSPYSHIDAKTARAFKPGDIPTFKDTKQLNWGSYDGSGDPIDLAFRDYFEKFVYDEDYADAPDVSMNKIVGQGNTVFNGKDLYPDASFVEFHFPGFDKQFDGMDWKSLVLVLRPAGGDWKLCAIVHGQWTI